MPWHGGLFLVGALAIAALPPLNGFASEWLTFQALAGARRARPARTMVAAGLAAALLALTGGLAAIACFVSAFGVAFLGVPRAPAVRARPARPRPGRCAGLALLAAGCAWRSVSLPGLALGLLQPAVALVGAGAAWPAARPDLVVGWPRPGRLLPRADAAVAARSGRAMLLLAAAGLAAAARCSDGCRPGAARSGSAASTSSRGCSTGDRLRRDRCGSSSARSCAAARGRRPRVGARAVLRRPARRYAAATLRAGRAPPLPPDAACLLRVANRLRVLQNGSLRTYLLYVFATLVGAAGGLAVTLASLSSRSLLAPACCRASIKTAKARLQKRRGPPLLQPYFDLWKLVRKGVVGRRRLLDLPAPPPWVVLAATLAAAALVPLTAPRPRRRRRDPLRRPAGAGARRARAGGARHRLQLRRHGREPRARDLGAGRAGPARRRSSRWRSRPARPRWARWRPPRAAPAWTRSGRPRCWRCWRC